MTDPQTVIFLHIGKTGGYTMRRILARNFPAPLVLQLRNPSPEVNGFLSDGPIRAFGELPEEDRGRPRLIMSHMIFGIHEFVPRPSTYITLLRNPLARAISGYKHVLRAPNHRLHEMVIANRMSLDDYVRSGAALEMDNSQARAITRDVSTPYGQCSRDMVEKAKRTIDERFTLAGLAERFDETLVVLHGAFGWKNLHYVRANVAKAKQNGASIPAKTRALIEEQNWVDAELHEFAAKKLEESIAAYAFFERDLGRFRLSNRLFGPWGRLTYSIPKRVYKRVRRHKQGRAAAG